MAALWTLNHVALNKGWAAGTSKSSTIRNVKNETTRGTTHYTFPLPFGTHALISLCKACIEMIKTFSKYKKFGVRNYVVSLTNESVVEKCPDLKA